LHAVFQPEIQAMDFSFLILKRKNGLSCRSYRNIRSIFLIYIEETDLPQAYMNKKKPADPRSAVFLY